MPLLYRKQGHTGILTLSRPEARNCWGQDYDEGLIRYLDEAADDDEIRCVILTGDEAGGAFSAGANLQGSRTPTPSARREAFIKSIGRAAQSALRPARRLPQAAHRAPSTATPSASAASSPSAATCSWPRSGRSGGCRRSRSASCRRYGGARRGSPARSARGRRCGWRMGFPLKAEEALSHRAGPVAGAARRADGAGARGRRPHRRAAAARRAPGQGVADRGLDIPNIADASLVDLYRFMALELTEDKAEAHEAWRERRKPMFRGR